MDFIFILRIHKYRDRLARCLTLAQAGLCLNLVQSHRHLQLQYYCMVILYLRLLAGHVILAVLCKWAPYAVLAVDFALFTARQYRTPTTLAWHMHISQLVRSPWYQMTFSTPQPIGIAAASGAGKPGAQKQDTGGGSSRPAKRVSSTRSSQSKQQQQQEEDGAGHSKKPKKGPAPQTCPGDLQGVHGPCRLCTCSNTQHYHVTSDDTNATCPCNKAPAHPKPPVRSRSAGSSWRHCKTTEHMQRWASRASSCRSCLAQKSLTPLCTDCRYGLLHDHVRADPEWQRFATTYGARVPEVTVNTCICRSCFQHDQSESAQPQLPKWYELMKEGEQRIVREATACCLICEKLGDRTNSTETTATKSCTQENARQMAFFFKQAYDVDANWGPHAVQLCTNHYQHFQKRLSSKGVDAATKFEATTKAPWVGTLYRTCTGCSATNSEYWSAKSWHLTGQYGLAVQAAIQECLIDNKSSFSQVISLTYRFADDAAVPGTQPSTSSRASGSDEQAAEASFADQACALKVELSGQDCCLGSCEWLCQCCWEQATGAFPHLHSDQAGSSIAGPSQLHQQQQQQQQQKEYTFSSHLSRCRNKFAAAEQQVMDLQGGKSATDSAELQSAYTEQDSTRLRNSHRKRSTHGTACKGAAVCSSCRTAAATAGRQRLQLQEVQVLHKAVCVLQEW